MPVSYIVTDLTGQVVNPGDPVIGGRAGVATFERVEYGKEHTGTARIRVSGVEYDPAVWGLIVEARDGVGCQLTQ